MQSLFKLLIILSATLAWLYFYFPATKVIYKDKIFNTRVCNAPVTYSINLVDSKFNISKIELSQTASQAVDIWKQASGKELFKEVQEDADINIILKFDDRQSTTNKLGDAAGTIQKENNQIELQKISYSTLELQYAEAKQNYEQLLKKYNSYRGADIEVLRKNEQNLQNSQQSLEILRTQVNSYASNLNTEVSSINQKINNYNLIQNKRGETFSEGEYVVKNGVRVIYVYEFEDRTKLLRLLTHEFGHALGLEHVLGDDSVMNAINSSKNLTLTKEDLQEFSRACKSSK